MKVTFIIEHHGESYFPVEIFFLGDITPPKFNIALKMDGWNTILSYWVSVTFQGRTVKLREGTG